VKIEVLKFDFLNEPGAVAKLFKILAGYEDEKIFRNKAIDVLVNRIWSEQYPMIVRFVFLPYLCLRHLLHQLHDFLLQTRGNGHQSAKQLASVATSRSLLDLLLPSALLRGQTVVQESF